jgi:hypothetical protein
MRNSAWRGREEDYEASGDMFWLTIKVLIIQILIRLRLRKNVWYKCEIELAKMKACKMKYLFDELDDLDDK